MSLNYLNTMNYTHMIDQQITQKLLFFTHLFPILFFSVFDLPLQVSSDGKTRPSRAEVLLSIRELKISSQPLYWPIEKRFSALFSILSELSCHHKADVITETTYNMIFNEKCNYNFYSSSINSKLPKLSILYQPINVLLRNLYYCAVDSTGDRLALWKKALHTALAL